MVGQLMSCILAEIDVVTKSVKYGIAVIDLDWESVHRDANMDVYKQPYGWDTQHYGTW